MQPYLPDALECRRLLSTYTFDDEFNGAVGSGPSSAWGKGNATDPNNAKVIYKNTLPAQSSASNPTTLQIVSDAQATDGKALAMSLVPDPGGSGNYFSSEITTEFDPAGAGNSLEYGHIEARIKLPGGTNSGAIWPAFWMLGDNITSNPWPACGEVDIMENDGAHPGTNDSTLHGPASGGADYNGGAGVGSSYTLAAGAAFYSAYHVFAADWGPNSVTFSVDGKAFSTITPASLPAGATWPFNGHPFYMILDVCEGGVFAPGTITSTQTMYVDYIHASSYSVAAAAPLSDQDIGSPAKAGSAYFDGSTNTLNGSGTDVWGTSDEFNFDSQAITGDATLITQVDWVGDTGQFAKGGLMIRDGTAANASYAFMQLNPGNAGASGTGGASFEFRNGAGTASASAGTNATANLQNGPIWLKLVRAGNLFSGYDSLDGGVTWNQIGTSQSIPMSQTVQVGLADDSNNPTSISTDTFSQLSILPGTFSDNNLGSPLRPGSAGYDNSNSTFTIAGGGTGITSASDQFNFASQNLTGDVAMVVDLTSQTSTNAAALAGAMLRNTSALNSAYAAAEVTPTGGVEFLWRTPTGTLGSATVTGHAAPLWVEITRYGNNFSAYYGTNGTSWTQIGTAQSMVFGSTIQAGLAVTSGDSITLNTAAFTGVQVLVPTSVTVSPATATSSDGQTSQLTASVLNQFGAALSPQPAAGVTWSIDSGGTGTVSSTGLYTAPASGPGSATVRATYETLSGTSTVTTTLSIINGTTNADTIRLVRSGTSLNVFINSNTSTYTVAYASLGAISINELGGNDTVTIDFSGGASPVPAAGITVDGGIGTNTLNLIGSASNDTFTITDATHLTVDGSAITYLNQNAIAVTGNGGNDTLTQSAQPGNAATLSFDGGTGDTLNISAGTFTLPAATSGGIASYSLASLSIGTGASVILASPVSDSNRTVLVLGALTIAGTTGAWTGKVDIGENDLIIHNGNLPQILDQIGQGFNATSGGNWTGQGIAPSFAAGAADHLDAIGAELNNDGTGHVLFGTGAPAATFDGQTPILTDVLIKSTYVGDTNLDGKVDGSDYSKIDFGFLNHLTGWSNGDLNYDDVINGSDYTLMDNAFNTQGAAFTASISTARSTKLPEAVAAVTADLIVSASGWSVSSNQTSTSLIDQIETWQEKRKSESADLP